MRRPSTDGSKARKQPLMLRQSVVFSCSTAKHVAPNATAARVSPTARSTTSEPRKAMTSDVGDCFPIRSSYNMHLRRRRCATWHAACRRIRRSTSSGYATEEACQDEGADHSVFPKTAVCFQKHATSRKFPIAAILPAICIDFAPCVAPLTKINVPSKISLREGEE